MTRQERRERERAQRRQVIVNAARELAEAEGWESVTTRRLADCIEYSQPVLYSHFEGKDAIVSAVALEGFGELAAVLHNARKTAGSPCAEPRAVAGAYLEFARANPALYEAMFTLRVDLTFAQSGTPTPLHVGFVELREALAPLAGDHDVETFTEVAWSALHGLATLSQAGRLRPAFYDQRIATLVDQLGTVRAEHGNLTNDHVGRADAADAVLRDDLGRRLLTRSGKRPFQKCRQGSRSTCLQNIASNSFPPAP